MTNYTLSTTLSVLILAMLMSCGNQKAENQALKLTVDSLSQVLEGQQRALTIMDEVGTMLDSIDNSRRSIFVEMEQGTSYEDYVQRMKQLNDYVRKTEAKLASMQDEMDRTIEDNQWFGGQFMKLKEELDRRNAEIKMLEGQIEEYQYENTQLIDLTRVQKNMIEQMDEELMAKAAELERIEARIDALTKQAIINDAESYFARGQALELAADRTKLAPKKKQETLDEAIEFYEKAAALGKEEAEVRIKVLKNE